MTSTTNQGTFDRNVATAKAFFNGFVESDIEAQMDMIADDLEYLPASYNGNVWLGKEEFRQVVQYFIDTFDDIIFTEGLGRTREESCGFFGGSAYPADADPSEISVVGTWTPTHRETGKKIYNKYFCILRFNEAGKINYCSEFFDASGIQVQLEAED